MIEMLGLELSGKTFLGMQISKVVSSSILYEGIGLIPAPTIADPNIVPAKGADSPKAVKAIEPPTINSSWSFPDKRFD